MCLKGAINFNEVQNCVFRNFMANFRYLSVLVLARGQRNTWVQFLDIQLFLPSVR